MAAPKIPKAVFNAIQKKIEQESTLPPKEKKEKKEQKLKKKKDGFEAKVEDFPDYDHIIGHLDSTVGLLTQAPVVTLCNKLCYSDRLTAQPCLYYTLSIPHFRVGQKRAGGIAPTTDDFYGTFASEISLFAFLMGILGLRRTHPIVQHSREYYKVSPKTFERKFSEKAINNFLDSIKKSRASPLGTTPIPHISQLGRGKKLYKAVWYFNTSNIEIPEALKYIDTNSVIDEEGLLEKMDPTLQSYRFNNYEDFCAAESAVQNLKEANANSNKYWRNIIKEKGAEEAARLYAQEFPPSEKKVTGQKRKTPTRSDEQQPKKKTPKRAEDDENLSNTMKDIESKISRSSAVNYYSDEESTGDEICGTQQLDFEEVTFSSSSSEDDEPEPVLQKTTPQPMRNSGNRPHVVQKVAPPQPRLPTPQRPKQPVHVNTRSNNKR